MNDNIIIDNILVSGYIRGQEYNLKLRIPQVITNTICCYCKQYIIQTLGVRHSTTCIDFQIFFPKTDCEQINVLNNDEKIIDIKSGSKHKLFLTSKGHVYGIGVNDSGQLGLGEHIKRVSTPTLVPIDDEIQSIACGKLHSLFLNKNGKLLICGFNYSGQLGITNEQAAEYNDDDESSNSNMYSSDTNNSDSDSDSDSNCESFLNYLTQCPCVFKPTYNKYFDDLNIRFKNINCGSHHSLCITTNGECFTFGENGFGNLGNGRINEWGTGDRIPYKIQLNKKFKECLCGTNYNILLTTNNEIVVFGANTKNQCSIQRQRQFESPYIISKRTEFGIFEDSFVEQIIHKNNKIMLLIDLYKRQLTNT
eukprot:522609_1